MWTEHDALLIGEAVQEIQSTGSRVECLYRFSVDAFEHISELTDAQNLRHDNARPIDLVVPRYIYNTPPTRHDTIRYEMLF